MITLEELKFNAEGLIPVVVQNDISGQVLAIAYMDEPCLQESLEKGYPCYRGVSAEEVCRREEQQIEKIITADDLDTLVVTVSGSGTEESDYELPLYVRNGEVQS